MHFLHIMLDMHIKCPQEKVASERSHNFNAPRVSHLVQGLPFRKHHSILDALPKGTTAARTVAAILLTQLIS